jgi:hypothetical protein
MKAVIVGNSGSGKTWLATNLAATTAVPVVHLDELSGSLKALTIKSRPRKLQRLDVPMGLGKPNPKFLLGDFEVGKRLACGQCRCHPTWLTTTSARPGLTIWTLMLEGRRLLATLLCAWM